MLTSHVGHASKLKEIRFYGPFGNFSQITKSSRYFVICEKFPKSKLNGSSSSFLWFECLHRMWDTLLNSKKFVFMGHLEIFRKLQKVQGIL